MDCDDNDDGDDGVDDDDDGDDGFGRKGPGKNARLSEREFLWQGTINNKGFCKEKRRL